MAYVDDPSQQQQDIQVAGATPLSTGQPTPAAQTQPEGGTGAPSGSQIQPQGGSAPRPQTGTQGSGKASSGQYTNIQKYVQKNQPQAQQMAGAVTQDVGRQAEAIRQQAAQKQAQQQQVLQANQQAITGAQDWATQQLQNIMQGVPAQEEGTPAFEIGEEQKKRFQALMRGEIEGVQDVGPLNIAQQQAQARALQQMTGQAGTAAGRQQLLGQTFQKQGEYTRGMSGLDELITGGDAAARQALTQGVMQQGEQLGAGLQDITSQSQQALGSQQQALRQATTGLEEQLIGAETSLEGDIEARLQAERDRLSQGQDEFLNALKTGEGLTEEMLRQYISDEDLAQLEQSFGARLREGLDSTQGREELINYLTSMGFDSNLANRVSLGINIGNIRGPLNDLLNRRLEQITPDSVVDSILQTAGTQDLSNLFSFTDPSQIAKQDVITPEQQARYQALSSLSGKEQLEYLPEYQQKDIDYGTADLSGLKSILPTGLSSQDIDLLESFQRGLWANRGKREVKTGGGFSVPGSRIGDTREEFVKQWWDNYQKTVDQGN